MVNIGADEQPWLNERVNDWLFAILRFAITLKESDRTATLSMGRILDASGVPESSRFSFFERTTVQICAALSDRQAPDSAATLLRHLAQIDHPRLASAFTAAVGLDRARSHRAERSRKSRADLWRGLAEPHRSA